MRMNTRKFHTRVDCSGALVGSDKQGWSHCWTRDPLILAARHVSGDTSFRFNGRLIIFPGHALAEPALIEWPELANLVSCYAAPRIVFVSL